MTGNSWTGEFKNLPKYNTDGTKIIYKVKELTAINTNLEENGYSVENYSVNFYGKCKKCS